MNERIEKVVTSVKTTWESQDRKHRIVYIGLAAAIPSRSSAPRTAAA